MDEARMSRIAALFAEAQEIPPGERAAFLRTACGTDEALRQEVLSLLAAGASSRVLFEDLASGVVIPAYDALLTRAAQPTSAELQSELEAALQGRYRVNQELAGGSISRVFLAEEVALGRQVVIKVLPPDLSVTMSGERFRREIQLAAQLQHPHIVPLLTGDAGGRLLYYTMPFVAGESLRVRLARDGALPLPDALRIWRDVLEALAYAHARNVVHRDIKPGNILLGDRHALVADFGIARAIQTAAGEQETLAPGLAIGTPAYMAPEQIDGGREVDHRVDLYAAGLVLYEMLEGRLPFDGDSAHEVLSARLTRNPAPIERRDCPASLAAIVQCCLDRDPAARPESAEALLARLEANGAQVGPSVPRRFLRALLGVGLTAATLAAVAVGWTLRRPATTPDLPLPVARPSIAVFPLASLSQDPDDRALSSGLTEELTTYLSKGGRLRVIAATSVLALANRGLSVRQVAESLRVSHVLEGSVWTHGTRLRLQFRLVDAADGVTRWSETFEKDTADIFTVPEDVARAVADELNLQAAMEGDRATPPRPPRTSVAAFEWYLRGRAMGISRSPDGLDTAIGFLHRAIKADSLFSAAYAHLVWLYLNRAGRQSKDYATWEAEALKAAERALALDPALPDAHSALGWSLMGLDLAGAEAALHRAVALNPAAHRAYEGLARVYMLARRPKDQLAAARRGVEINPYSVQALRELALGLNMNDRCDETLELLRPLKALTPPAGVAAVIMGQCYARKGLWPEAIGEFRWALENTEARMALSLLGYALARGGDEAEARHILADLLAGRRQSHGAFGIAVVYTGLRDYDHAFTWLQRAADEGSIRVYIVDPLFEDLHRDPRFDRFWSHPGAAPTWPGT